MLVHGLQLCRSQKCVAPCDVWVGRTKYSLKIDVPHNIMSCWMINSYRLFRKAEHLPVQGQAGLSQFKKYEKFSWIVWCWRWRYYISRKHQQLFASQHSIISQKIWIFISTTARASDLRILVVHDIVKEGSYWGHVFTWPPSALAFWGPHFVVVVFLVWFFLCWSC